MSPDEIVRTSELQVFERQLYNVSFGFAVLRRRRREEEEDEREREREGREHAASQRETQRTTEGLSAWRAGPR